MTIVETGFPQSLTSKRVEQLGTSVARKYANGKLNVTFKDTSEAFALIVANCRLVAEIDRSGHVRGAHVLVMAARVD